MSEEKEKDTTEDSLGNLFARFTGMFSSGKTDTSERMQEILRETNFDPAEGFSSGIKPQNPPSESS